MSEQFLAPEGLSAECVQVSAIEISVKKPKLKTNKKLNFINLLLKFLNYYCVRTNYALYGRSRHVLKKKKKKKLG